MKRNKSENKYDMFISIQNIYDMILEYSLSHYAIMNTNKALNLVLYGKKGCVVVFQIIIKTFLI